MRYEKDCLYLDQFKEKIQGETIRFFCQYTDSEPYKILVSLPEPDVKVITLSARKKTIDDWIQIGGSASAFFRSQGIPAFRFNNGDVFLCNTST